MPYLIQLDMKTFSYQSSIVLEYGATVNISEVGMKITD